MSMCVRFVRSRNNSEEGYDVHCTVGVVTPLPSCCRAHRCDSALPRSVRSRFQVFDVLCCRRSVSSLVRRFLVSTVSLSCLSLRLAFLLSVLLSLCSSVLPSFFLLPFPVSVRLYSCHFVNQKATQGIGSSQVGNVPTAHGTYSASTPF